METLSATPALGENLDFSSPFYTPAAASEPVNDETESHDLPADDQPSTSAAAEVAEAPAPQPPVKTYEEMFPSLPTASKPSVQPVYPAYASKTREHTERLQLDPAQIRPSGLGDKAHTEICKSVMAETGTRIDFSTSKNKSMTVIISGKPEKVAIAKKKFLAAISKQFEAKVEISKEHLSSFIGKAGSKLKQLQEKTGTKIIVPKVDEESEFVTILGDKASVEEARRQILEFTKEKNNFARETIHIDETYQPFVFGPGNEAIKSLSQETGAKIQLPHGEDGNQTEVIIFGPREGVTEAMKRIQATYAEKKRSTKSMTLSVNKKQHRFIIGPKGVYIQEIFAETGCFIKIPPLEDPSENVVIHGDENKIIQAVTLVLEKTKSVCLEEIDIEGAQLQRYIKVKGRQLIKDLEKGTKSFINVGPTKIDFQGPKEEVEQIRKKIIDYISEFKSLKFDELEVPVELRKFIIGKKGQNLQKIKTDFGVEVFVPHDDEDIQTIFLAGPKDKIKPVKDSLTKTLKEVANLTVVELKVEPKFHKTIVGKKGETIKKLNEEFEECSIKVPGPKEESDLVILRGPKDDVEKLRKQIVKLVEDTRHYEIMHNFTEEIQIDRKAIKYIVGKGGAAINRIREAHDVKIDIEEKEEEKDKKPETKEESKEESKEAPKGKGKGKPAEPSTIKVTIQGTKKGVETAKEALLTKAKEILEGGGYVTVELNIDRKFHGNLIGSQGKFVKSLMDRHSINVRFPRSDAPSDIVVLAGLQKAVEKAKEELLELLEYEKSISFTDTLTAKNAVLRQVMGVGSENSKIKLLQIMDKTKTQVDFEDNNKEGDKIIIKGPEKGVAAAKQLVQQYIDEVANTVTEAIEIDPQFHRVIIGLKGGRVRELSEKHNSQIKFPADKTSKTVVLSGLPKNVASLKAEILSIIGDLEGEKAAQITKTFEIPHKYHPGLKDFLRNHGPEVKAKVSFPKEGEEPNTVVLKGREDEIDAAFALLQENYEENLTLKVPRELHRLLLAGGKIKELNQTLGVIIRFPDRESKSENILIRGKQALLPEAEKAFLALVEEAKAKNEAGTPSTPRTPKEAPHTQVLTIDPKFVGRVIGKKGSNIRELSDLSQARIDLAKDSGTITISGTKEAVEFAVKELKALIKEFESQTVETLNVDVRYHNRLAGTRFANIFKIQDDFGVKIKLNRDNNTVVISGNVDDVKTAADFIKESIKEIELDQREERKEKERESEPRERESQPKQNGRASSSKSSFPSNDPFFAPPPSSSAPAERVSVWGPKMA